MIERCYREFLLHSHDHEEREYSDATDQIREVLIHENYMSQMDIKLCLAHDLSDLRERGEVPRSRNFTIVSRPPMGWTLSACDILFLAAWWSFSAPSPGGDRRGSLAFRVLVKAAPPHLADALTAHGVLLHPICQEELYDPGRDVSINPNKHSILTPQRPRP